MNLRLTSTVPVRKEGGRKMNPETLEALEGSIKKWTAIVRSTKRRIGDG